MSPLQMHDEPRPGCCSCGEPLILIARQTMSSPEEWGCPVCDGGREPGAYERDGERDESAYDTLAERDA